MRQAVEDVIAAPDTDPTIKDAWATAVEFQRLSPAIIALGERMGWSPEYMDRLFEQAAEITV
jgi:hypothetical protein